MTVAGLSGTGPPEPVEGATGPAGSSPNLPEASEQARAAIARGDAASAVRSARQSGDHRLLARAYELKALLDREPAWLAHALDALLAAAAREATDETCNAAIDLALKIGALDQAAGRFKTLSMKKGESSVYARALERVRDLALLQVPEPKKRGTAQSRVARMSQDLLLFPIGLTLTVAGFVTRAAWSNLAGAVGILLIACWAGLRFSRLARRPESPSGW